MTRMEVRLGELRLDNANEESVALLDPLTDILQSPVCVTDVVF